MNKWTISGALFLVMGAAAFVVSQVISDKVDAGEEKFQQCLGFWGQVARFFGSWPKDCVDGQVQLLQGMQSVQLSFNIGVSAEIIGVILIAWGLWRR